MTHSTSPVTASSVPMWEEVSFPNPSLSCKKWNFSYDDGESLKKTLGTLSPVVSIVLFFALFSKFGPFGHYFGRDEVGDSTAGGLVYLGIFFGMLISSFFIASALGKRMVKKREQARDGYRADNAHIIIDGLAEKGWKIVGSDAVRTLIKDNSFHVQNKDGIRYYVNRFNIGVKNIDIVMRLSDSVAEKMIGETQKQSRIEFLVKRYEAAHGAMTEEMKAGFIAGLRMGLPLEK